MTACPPPPFNLDEERGPLTMLLFGLGEIVAVLLIHYGGFRTGLIGTTYVVGLLLVTYFCFFRTGLPEAVSEWFLCITSTVLTILHVLTLSVPKETKLKE